MTEQNKLKEVLIDINHLLVLHWLGKCKAEETLKAVVDRIKVYERTK